VSNLTAVEIARELVGLRDPRTAAPGRIDALMALEPGRTMFRPTVHMSYRHYAWLRDHGLIEGDTDSCLLTELGAEVRRRLAA